MKRYDYLIVGSGLSGAAFAYKASAGGKKCLVLEKRHHLGGYIYSEVMNGIPVHKIVRLAQYEYYFMAPVIENALSFFSSERDI